MMLKFLCTRCTPLVVAAGLLLANSPLVAGLVVIDPDDYAPGTDISNAFDGVTLSAVGSQSGGSGVFAVTGPFASTGTSVFGHNASLFDPYDWTRLFDYVELKASFDQPTDFVSIDIVGLNQVSSFFSGRLQAFDSSGTSLAVATTSDFLFAGEVKTLTITRPQRDIAFVLASGGSDVNALDNLTFSAVPEPSSLALLGIGCAAIATRRRRRS